MAILNFYINVHLKKYHIANAYNTGQPKKFKRKKFRSSDSFSPAEYEYESFFLSSPDFPKFLDIGLKINKIVCL